MSTRALFGSALDEAARVISDDAVATHWHEPSVLASWSVGGVAGHLARAGQAVLGYLDAEVDADADVVSAAGYFAAIVERSTISDVESEFNRAIRARGDQAAAAGHADVVGALDECRSQLAGRLANEPTPRPMTVFGGITMDLDQYLLTRIVEIAVHTDDLCLSVGIPAREVPGLPEAIEVLVEVARMHRGNLAVLRALTRRERDPDNVLRVL